MKFLFAFIFGLCIVSQAFSQVLVGDVDINQDESIQIVEVLVTEKFSSKSVNVYVDYGQKTNFRAGSLDGDDKARTIFDPEKKKERVFTSTAALLGFMESNGWEHYDSLVSSDNAKAREFYFYFKKRR